MEEEKNNILEILNEVKSNVDLVNLATKDVIKALLEIFKERKINSEGIFNANEDGIVDEIKYRKAINDTQNNLNDLIGSLGADAQKGKTAARTIERKLKRRRDNNQPLELLEDELNDIAFDSELSLEIVKRIYAEQLLKMGLSVNSIRNSMPEEGGEHSGLIFMQNSQSVADPKDFDLGTDVSEEVIRFTLSLASGGLSDIFFASQEAEQEANHWREQNSMLEGESFG